MPNKTMYEKSQLGQYISNLLQEIKSIRKNTKKEKDIDSIMSIISSLVELADDTFRCFDNKEIPGWGKLLRLGGKYALLFSVKGSIAGLKIDPNKLKKDHIEFLNFFKKTIDGLLKILPDQIEDFLPFVNLQKIPAFFTEGYVMNKIQQFLVEKIPCYIMATDLDDIAKIKPSRPSAYYCNYRNKRLFYLNRMTSERIEVQVPLAQWDKWVGFAKETTRKLKKSDLDNIQKLTGHSHQKEITYKIDRFSIDDKLNVDFKSSLTGKDLKIKMIDHKFNLNEFYQFFTSVLRHFQAIVIEKKNFLKSLVTFISASKNADVFAAANYYLAFLNAILGDLQGDNDVTKMIEKSSDLNPSYSFEPEDNVDAYNSLNVQIDDLKGLCMVLIEKLKEKNELSIDYLTIMQTSLDASLNATIEKYESSQASESVIGNQALETITEGENLRASIKLIQITIKMMEKLEAELANASHLTDEQKQQSELATFIFNPKGVFQKRYQMINRAVNDDDLLFCQTILERMDALKLQIGAEATLLAQESSRKLNQEIPVTAEQLNLEVRENSASQSFQANSEKSEIEKSPELSLEIQISGEHTNLDAQKNSVLELVQTQDRKSDLKNSQELGQSSSTMEEASDLEEQESSGSEFESYQIRLSQQKQTNSISTGHTNLHQDEDVKKIENLIEAIKFYRYRIEKNQEGHNEDFSAGFSALTRWFKSDHRKANYNLTEKLLSNLIGLQGQANVSAIGLFSKNNIKQLREKPKFNCGVNSKDLNYIFKSARNLELVDLNHLEKAKDGTDYSSYSSVSKKLK